MKNPISSSKKDILLSVIVPVYNTEEFLERCIGSLIVQTCKSMEIIVVNDCSPGEPEKLLNRYINAGQNIRILKHEENKGLFLARMSGVAKASGKYIAFVDSDDYVSIDFYRQLLDKADEGNFDIVCGNTVRVNECGEMSQMVYHDICIGNTPIYGENVRNTFFSQEGACYAWHTIWNKIYRKSLWDKCSKEYENLKGHIVMTEDIAFSSLLFYNAKSFIKCGSGVYYYVINEKASTNSSSLTYEKYIKNVRDVTSVFNFVGSYLKKVNAPAEIMKHYEKFRYRYYCIWHNYQKHEFSQSKQMIVRHQIEELKKDISIEHDEAYQNEIYLRDLDAFDRITAQWYDDLEKIKKEISSSDIEIVSFDIFDTLLLRPLWNPSDVFIIMQKQFEHICPELIGCQFIELRQAAENKVRGEIRHKYVGVEDCTLSEIYEKFSELFGVSRSVSDELKRIEIETETRLLYPRSCARDIFDFAKACGKRVIIVSDMYLEKKDIEYILAKNGYAGYEKLYLSSDIRLTKDSGNLFTYVINDMQIAPTKIYHIGDNWNADVCISRNKKMRSGFLPKAKDRFTNHFEYKTNCCANIASLVGCYFTEWDRLEGNFAYRSMQAIVANKYFDNPFKRWVKHSDFSCDPYFVGYYTVGMHLIAISHWLVKVAREKRTNEIVFLARDGYMPLKACEALKKYFKAEDIKLKYVACSRLAMLPWMINGSEELISLPVSRFSHSPMSFCKLLNGMMCSFDEDVLERQLKESNISADRHFVSDDEYIMFLKWFSENLFSEKIMIENRKLSQEYYKNEISSGSIVFDMGYSGKIPYALNKCLGYSVNFAYLYADNKAYQYERKGGFNILSMYDMVPPNCDLIREYILSEPFNSCVGFKRQEGRVVPVYSNICYEFTNLFSIKKISEGALDFVHDFKKYFESCVDFEINPFILSLPFEGLLHASVALDRQILKYAYTEDGVYGNIEKISVGDFWENIIDNSVTRDINSSIRHSRQTFDAIPPENGVLVKAYNKINKIFPKGTKRRLFIKRLVRLFVQ